MNNEFCVAAEDRSTGKRSAITGSLSKDAAMSEKNAMNRSSWWKKMYRYFHVASWPYKSTKK